MMPLYDHDNIAIDVHPFKGPFKGKGTNRVAVQTLREDLASINERMVSIVESFRDAVPRGVPVYLSIHKPRGFPQLWWRKSGGAGKYIKLFDDHQYLSALRNLLPATMQLVCDFDRCRLHYNLKATIVGHSLEHYIKYGEGQHALDRFLAAGRS